MLANPNTTLNPTTDVDTSYIHVGDLVTVTIGRNIGDLPMRHSEWLRFQDHVRFVLRYDLEADIFGPFSGQGEWNGVTEESVVHTGIARKTCNTERFGEILTGLAHVFNQDAIAWSFGAGRLAVRP